VIESRVMSPVPGTAAHPPDSCRAGLLRATVSPGHNPPPALHKNSDDIRSGAGHAVPDRDMLSG
jgi:hypothetical protein